MVPWALGCFMVAGQCHETGNEGGKGAPLPACGPTSSLLERRCFHILHLNTLLPATTPSSERFALLFEGVKRELEL